METCRVEEQDECFAPDNFWYDFMTIVRTKTKSNGKK